MILDKKASKTLVGYSFISQIVFEFPLHDYKHHASFDNVGLKKSQ